MDQANTHVFDLHEECIRICAELRLCLGRERTFLVELKVDEIPHVTLQKESLVLSLTRKRRELKDYIRHCYGFDKVSLYAERLEGDERASWIARETRWRIEWAELREAVRSNQDFLKHSLKMFSTLADSLKRCLGEPSLYSAKGARVEAQVEGKVVAGSY